MAWTRYAKSVQAGEVIELDADYEEWVSTALEQAVKPKVEIGG